LEGKGEQGNQEYKEALTSGGKQYSNTFCFPKEDKKSGGNPAPVKKHRRMIIKPGGLAQMGLSFRGGGGGKKGKKRPRREKGGQSVDQGGAVTPLGDKQKRGEDSGDRLHGPYSEKKQD